MFLLSSVVAVVAAMTASEGECDCYVQMTLRDKPGLGHRVSMFVIGAAIATRARCHYVVEMDRFFGSRGLHGSFEWAPPFFALNASVASLMPAAPTHLTTSASRFPALLQSRVCDAVMLLDDFSCTSVKEGWCGQHAGMFDTVKWQFRAAFWSLHAADWSAWLAARNASVQVAWHVRVGDMVLDADNVRFYTNVFDALWRLTAPHDMDVHFVFECPTCRAMPRTHRVLHELCDGPSRDNRRHACTFDGSRDVAESIRVLIFSDVLVTSGSSFSDVAALYHRGVVLMRDSATGIVNAFRKADDFRVSSAGAVTGFDEARAQFQLQFDVRLGQCAASRRAKTGGQN